MFVAVSKTLKRAGGFRFAAGIRITKKNAWFMLFILMFAYMFQAAWYMMIGICWLTYYGMYWLFYGLYKIYYYLFKWSALGVKKLYSFIKGKIDAKKAENSEIE